MIRPADWHLMEWATRERPEPAVVSARFVVRRTSSAWGVNRDGAAYGRFADLNQAVAHACQLARHQARCGVMSVVMVETQPYELHSFMPTLTPVAEDDERPFTE